ncbi:MAG TPA: hypothetical protein ENK05_09720 [Gammaproteobacteria bacterium]|nr:hypothetical protein [Gammaproteobacteria bacterium]
MNIYAQFPHQPAAPVAPHPPQVAADQASARPVDRPPPDEAGNNQARQQDTRDQGAEGRFRPADDAAPRHREERRIRERQQARSETAAFHPLDGKRAHDLQLERDTPPGQLLDVTA